MEDGTIALGTNFGPIRIFDIQKGCFITRLCIKCSVISPKCFRSLLGHKDHCRATWLAYKMH